MAYRTKERGYGYPEGTLPQSTQIVDKLVLPLTDFSEYYPRHLGGVTAGVGLVLLDGLDRGNINWNKFVQSELKEKDMSELLYRTGVLHQKNKINPAADSKVPQVMSIVYELTKSSIVSSIYALSQGDLGQKYSKVPKIIDPEMADVVRKFLMEGERAKANREAILALFTVGASILVDKEKSLGASYLKALQGQKTQLFPDAAGDSLSIAATRNLLSHHMRRLFLSQATFVGLQHGLSQSQVETFVHNSTRV